MRCSTTLPLALPALLLVCSLAARPDEPVLPPVPAGLPSEVPTPADNPADARVHALGEALFFSTELSIDRSVSCASCHRPEASFASPERFPEGARGRRARRHAPALLNRAWGTSFLWDGRAATLEEQVLMPIEDPDEMALGLDEAVARLVALPRLAEQFEAAFGEAPSAPLLARALAAYVRRLFSGDSVVDAFRAGKFNALTPDERGGMWLFDSKAGCWRCHGGWNFTDEGFHNTGVGVLDGVPEAGRAAISGDDDELGAFKTPTLRGLATSAPYMHDGSQATLEEVVEFYRRGGEPNAALDASIQPLELTDEEARLLVAFLRALSRPHESGEDEQ